MKKFLFTFKKDEEIVDVVISSPNWLDARLQFMSKFGSELDKNVFSVEINPSDVIANAMEKLMFFTANFPRDFIEQCWDDDKLLANHLREKLMGIVRTSPEPYTTSGDIIKFCFELDTTSREKLFNWIEENYSHKGGIKW